MPKLNLIILDSYFNIPEVKTQESFITNDEIDVKLDNVTTILFNPRSIENILIKTSL
jgi:hypothetical protein